MPRARTFRTSEFPYHLSVRCNNAEIFPISPDRTWDVVTSTLGKSSEKYGVDVHGLVQMSNHLHVMVTTPNSNVDRFASHFLSLTSVRIASYSHRTNHIFGTRYRATLLDTAYSFAYVLKYIYRNPVRAGICETVQEYEFSTLTSTNLPFSLSLVRDGFRDLIPVERPRLLAWLNQPTPKEQEELIRRGLRRSRFRFTTDNNFKRALKSLRMGYGVEEVV